MTLMSLLRDRATGATADAAGLHLGGETWSWARYWEEARSAAAGLRAAGVARGDHVVVVALDVATSVRAILGAWAIGATVTPVGIPLRVDDVAACVRHVADCAQIVDARTIIVPRMAAGFVTAPNVLVGDDLAGDGDVDPDAATGELALLQLTSGTTGRPRGVMVSHERLLAHLGAMAHALPLRADAVGLSWLPLFHDMGLIGGLLFPLFCGFPLHLTSPQAFRANPFGWLENLARYRVAITPAPPSVWGLCTRLAPRAVERGLDLSHLDCALVGAEPISARVLGELATALAPCGFSREAFFPVYGLAEATLAVTFPRVRAPRTFDRIPLDADGRAHATFVGVGRPLPGTELRIVDADAQLLPERAIGRIQIRAPHAMVGYYGEPALGPRDWIDTGDLGYLVTGELFVTGRHKELIIRAGQNLVPAHLEEIAARVEGVRAGGVAAVGVWSERLATERAWVVAETRAPATEHAALAQAIRDALKAHGIDIDGVHLIGAGTLPKTTSGKLVRGRVAELLAHEAA